MKLANVLVLLLVVSLPASNAGKYIKEAASCLDTRINGPDGQALLFSNYSAAFAECETRSDCSGVYDHSCIDPNDPSAVCQN